MQRAGRRSGFLRALMWLVFAVLLLPPLLLAGLYAAGGYVKTPSTFWYPFVPSLLSDYYTTGPFAMTSNTREDNPVWSELPKFNKSLARLTYAMSRGEAGTEVAWLLADAEWVDKPALGEGNSPNAAEAPLSKALVAAGLGYDRISRSNLVDAHVVSDRLQVGEASYRALLIDDLHIADPGLLEQVVTIAQAGIPVHWQGQFPARAPGWAQHQRRDAEVRALSVQLQHLVSHSAVAEQAIAALAASGVQSQLQPVEAGNLKLRIAHRRLDNADLFLLYNETAADLSREFRFGRPWVRGQTLDPVTGQLQKLHSDRDSFSVTVPARRTRLVLLHASPRNLSAAEGNLQPETAPAASWSWQQWQNPSRDMYPFIRWWWPGNAVETDQLRRELSSLHAAGYGGVELQTLSIGLSQQHLVDNEQDIYQVGDAAYFDHVKAVFELAAELDMSVDLTLGSGWSSGGPFIDRYPEQQLLQAAFDVRGPVNLRRALPAPTQPWYVTPTNWVIRDTIGEFDSNARLHAVVAARVDEGTRPATLVDPVDISAKVQGDTLSWQVPAGDYRVFALYQNATSHNVAASAYPGALDASPVLDHLDAGGANEYIEDLGAPWLAALAPYKPNAFFIDSFELIGELPWSSGFAQRFFALHGYDVTPYLPLLFMQRGESKYVNVVIPPAPAYRGADDMQARLREDYDATRQRLFIEAFLQPIKAWVDEQGISLRVQAHGGYGDYLDAYQLADIPESEGLFAGGSYDFLKLAASAGHVAGRRMISSESFITMSLDFNALTIEDYYRLAGNAYAAGINRTVCHGYAYHYLAD